jgi:L-malate glycosyltransferase
MHLTAVDRRVRVAGAGPRPVRVCFVIDRLSRAGTESQLLSLIRQLDRARVEPTLCLLNGGDAASQALLPRDCPTLDLGLRRLLHPAAVPAAIRLSRFWARHRTEVVQTYFLDSTYFAAPLARACGIRHVVRVRNNIGYWLTARHRQLGKVIGRLCRITLTNSSDGRGALLAEGGLPPERVRVIENGVDLDRFPTPTPPNTGRAAVRIGAVANLRPVKNIDGLVRAAAHVCREHPRARFEVAGEGELRADLEGQARAAGLADRFTLVGPVADVPGFLSRLDVAVLCSHSESMSNALLEYMAAGRAIVATDVGANARIVRHEREGLIVPAGDDASLAQGVCRYLRDPALAIRLGAAARRRAEDRFAREAMVLRFEEFFTSLVFPDRLAEFVGPDS